VTKTAIVILNWNGRALLERFIPSILSYSGSCGELIIADNASTDDSVEWLKKTYPQLRVIVNPKNEGFAGGYNLALQQVEATYFMLLNSDVEVTPGWLSALENHLDNNPDTAICQPKILWEKDRDSFEYSGAAGGFIDFMGYPFCRGRIFGELEKDNGQYNTVCDIFWASGACMLVRSDVFNKAGGFDSTFFAHMEEIDLCWRIRNLGYNITCVPESVVYHIGGATLPKNNPGKTYLNFRNNLSMLWKNLPASRVFPVIVTRLVLDGVAGLKFLSEGHWRDCVAVIKAHLGFYRRILAGRLKRSKNISEMHHATIYHGSIVKDYYLSGKKHFSELKFKNQ